MKSSVGVQASLQATSAKYASRRVVVKHDLPADSVVLYR
jgi:hypothetical protein